MYVWWIWKDWEKSVCPEYKSDMLLLFGILSCQSDADEDERLMGCDVVSVGK